MQRDAKANEESYLLYLSKREQAQSSEALDKTRIANVTFAVPPAIPALPAHGFPFILLVGLGRASVIAIVVAYIVEHFAPSFHTSAQVIDTLDIPLVVSIAKRTA
ncbi:MAG: hypothetical protein WBE72_10430 [Terracidiphilus sp.]